MRFPVTTCLPAVALGAFAVLLPVATAQSTPAQQTAFHQATRIDDIQVSETDGVVSILVKLSSQPSAAFAEAKGDRLTLEIDGVSLTPLSFQPAPGSLLSRVAASGNGNGNSTLTLEGAAFGDSSATIYRNAVLVEARLADPKLAATSLMPDRASAATPTPVEPTRPSPAAPVHAPAPVPSPRPVAEVAATPSPEPSPKPSQGLESYPAPAASLLASLPEAPATPKSVTAASLAQLDDARCAAAAIELDKDPWALTALGDHALCLLDAKKPTEAANRLDQLAAFAPEDWRVALGRAALALEKGDASNAVVGYKNAAMLAPDADMRTAINAAANELTHN